MENNLDVKLVTTLLSDKERFKVAAAVALGAGTPDSIMEITKQDDMVIVQTLVELEEAGLLMRKNTGYTLDVQVLQELNREIHKNNPE